MSYCRSKERGSFENINERTKTLL